MEGFKRGFYTTSKKLERRPEFNLGQYSFPQPQLFSQSQQPGEEQKQVQKIAHATTPTSQEKHSSLGGLGVQSFQPDEYEITHQSGVEPPGRGQEAKKGQWQANGESKQARRNLIKSYVPGKRFKCFLKHSQDQSNQSQSQQQKQTEIGNRIEKIEENQQNYNYKWGQESTKVIQCRLNKKLSENLKKIEVNKNQKKMLLLLKLMTFMTEMQEILAEKTELLDPRKEKKETRRNKNKPNVLQSKWRSFQNQERCDKTSTGKERKVNLEKTEFPISLKLEVPDIFIQQQGA